MESVFHSVSEIAAGKDGWRIKVRVLRMWEVPTFMKPDITNSMEMVLIDEEGSKIHASVRKQLLYVFQSKLSEGKVYNLSCFSVAPSAGSYRTTQHPYKIIFQMITKVQVSEGFTIPKYGVSLTKLADVCAHTYDYDYLVDVVGLMTGISNEREYIRDGKVTKMVVFQLTNDSGSCECALFGKYVDALNKLMGKAVDGMPVVLVQFAKVKIFKDKASLQNVLNTTRILINPPIEEAARVRKSVSSVGMDLSSVPKLGPRVRVSVEEDFLRMHPKKTLAQLHDTPEDGTFVVYATVDGFVDGEDWWYPACKCHRSVAPDSGAYYCKGCVKHVFQMVPRYRVKINVSDATSVAVFVMFDGDVQNILNLRCRTLVSASKAENAGFYPAEFAKLKDKKMLFKVEKYCGPSIFFDGSFRVKRVCDESSVIQSFDSLAVQYTPSKPLSKNPMPETSPLPAEPEEEDGPQVDNFVNNVVVTPRSVIEIADEEFSNDLPTDVDGLASVGEVVAAFDVAGSAESTSLAVGVEPESAFRSSGSGAKRNLSSAFDQVDSDDEAEKYGRIRKT